MWRSDLIESHGTSRRKTLPHKAPSPGLRGEHLGLSLCKVHPPPAMAPARRHARSRRPRLGRPCGQGIFVSPREGFCGSTLEGQNANIHKGFGEGGPGGTIGRWSLIAF